MISLFIVWNSCDSKRIATADFALDLLRPTRSNFKLRFIFYNNFELLI